MQNGVYPDQVDLIRQVDALADTLEREGVTVLRPELIKGCNQIFMRDVAFVIEDRLFLSNLVPNRAMEAEGVTFLLNQLAIDQVIRIEDPIHVEGGDVIVHGDYLFVGVYTGKDYKDYITARTNAHAVKYLQQQFPEKHVKAFELKNPTPTQRKCTTP